MAKNLRAYKRTHDWWCGNYNKNYVRVQYCDVSTYAPDPFYRVGVWGNDDMAMIQDFKNESDALSMFRKLVDRRHKYVDMEDLEILGFEFF